MDVAQRRAAQTDGGGHVAQTALHQHHVCRVERDVRARADGDADVRAGECRSVVDAVADHSDLAALAQAADLRFLAVGQYAGDHAVHARGGADGARRAFVVAREHDDLDAHIPQLAHGLRAVGFDDVRHGDDAEESAVFAEQQRRFAVLRKRLAARPHGGGDLRRGGNVGETAAAERLPVPHGGQAAAGERPEVRDLIRGQAVGLCPGEDRAGERMLALLLERKRRAKQLRFAYTVCGKKLGDLRLARSDGAGLVQRDDVHAARLLQRRGGFEQNAVLRAQSAADHDGDGRGEPQRAGTADDEHGNAAREGEADALTEQQPHGGRHRRDGNDGRHEYAGDPVRDLCDGGLGRGGVADHLNDLRKRGVLADARGAAAQEAGLVDRRGGDRVARGLVHRQALARQRRLVDGACAVKHHAVHGDALARADHEDVVPLHLLDGDLKLPTVAFDHRGLRGKLHQAFERVGRAALGAGLEHLADGDEREDHGGGLEVEVHHVGHHGLCVAAHLRTGHGEEGVGAVAEGCRRTEGDERIHVRCAAPQALEAADEEFLVDDHDGDR